MVPSKKTPYFCDVKVAPLVTKVAGMARFGVGVGPLLPDPECHLMYREVDLQCIASSVARSESTSSPFGFTVVGQI